MFINSGKSTEPDNGADQDTLAWEIRSPLLLNGALILQREATQPEVPVSSTWLRQQPGKVRGEGWEERTSDLQRGKKPAGRSWSFILSHRKSEICQQEVWGLASVFQGDSGCCVEMAPGEQRLNQEDLCTSGGHTGQMWAVTKETGERSGHSD